VFEKKVLFLGYGSVAQCALPIFVRHLQAAWSNITVLEFEDRAEALAPWVAQGLRFVRERVTPENLDALLRQYLSPGDLLIDLAWNIDCREILNWCHDRGVLYINTSVEVWNPYAYEDCHPTERTLYHRHMQLRRLRDCWASAGTAPGPTAVVEHGANPGLISHFMRQGLVDIAQRLIADGRVDDGDADQLRQWIDAGAFNYLAMKLGVKVIHVSERDTQISDRPKEIDEFVNTWSVEGFREEGTTTSEMGWGTHEKQLPPLAYEHQEGPRNQICLARMGMNTRVRSWVPNFSIEGLVVRHGEAFTISDTLTVWKGGKAIYRPTVHYAYCPCDAAIASLHELRGRNYKIQSRDRILRDEITGGSDLLGALLMGHAYRSWWTGSELSIKESRRLLPHQNATTMQVAISVVSAIMWMLDNPCRGLCVPDDLPYERILADSAPYLGKLISTPSDWTPLADYKNYFRGYNRPDLDYDDPWQFKNFLITDSHH
jgi:homospermidine synthase